MNGLTTKDFENIKTVGKLELYDLPNRAACESAKSNLYRWGAMQKPTRTFSCSVKDNHILLVIRKS